ncbi:MAG TPA: peptidoglycan DD-metalloendopeptidase family protein [Telluria sp.]|nr:peptidoglycan DD-metalloendopeptidase family protein [Telluria sp.]
MKQTRPFVLLILSLGLLSACSTTTRHAPVIDRVAPRVASRPVAPPVDDVKEDARGTYTVKRGDTLLRIALDHGQNYHDVVAWNNLANPNDIKVDQVLRMAPPANVAVQTSPVSMPEIRPSAPAVPKKTAPRGEKRPYSEKELAELRKEENVRQADKDEPKTDKPIVVAAAPSVAPGAVVRADSDERLSWQWPSDGKVVATFDEGKNKGIDIAGKLGQQVLAAGAGKVMYAGSGIRGYGNLVIVKHSNSLLSAYAHNRSIVVKEGDNVNKGQMIAEMGDSDSDSVKLHFEIRQQGKPVDPARFLPTR